jgi:transcriptional regulator with XRE-family HTH domain
MAAREQDVLKRAMLGRNLSTARKLAGLTQEHVAQQIWGTPTLKTRVSEFESGRKLPDLEMLHFLCSMYSISADYILGFSVEPEIDQTAGRVGMIYNHLSQLATEMMQDLAMQMSANTAKHLAVMPKPQNMALLESAKQVHRMFVGKSSPDELSDAIVEMAIVIREIETKIALGMQGFDVAISNIHLRDDLTSEGHLLGADLNGIKNRAASPMALLRPASSKGHQSVKDAQGQLTFFLQQENDMCNAGDD